MNSTLKILLDSYEDFELANLSHYKLQTYLEETQGSIIEYLHSRGLTKSKINNLVLNTKEMVFSDSHPRCPRCKSSRLLVDRVEWAHTVGGSVELPPTTVYLEKQLTKTKLYVKFVGFILLIQIRKNL